MSSKMILRIAVDRALCQGHNRCKRIAPELFELDEYGIASVVGDGLVPDHLHEQARLAESNCPEFAVSVTEESAGGSQ
jgi:ferredoxin